ncbi:unnamed protein product [Peniophora sp. CBMAI 1063]|nr:unnamed protein product [Peniophora sp. CBMAI 1063]
MRVVQWIDAAAQVKGNGGKIYLVLHPTPLLSGTLKGHVRRRRLRHRKINTAAPFDDEEDGLFLFANLESKLLAHNPTVDLTQTHASLSTARSLLLTTFRPSYPENDACGNMRVHFSTQRWRAVEPWFTPGMAGVNSAGLGALAGNVLGMFAPNVRARLASTVFLTGGAAGIPGMGEWLTEKLKSGLPLSTPDAAPTGRLSWRLSI